MAAKIAVIGAGSWGTTLACILGSNNSEVLLWVREEKIAEEINLNHENSHYLKGIKIPSTVKATNSFEEAVTDADIIVSVVPVQYTREVAQQYLNYLKKGAIIVNASKGIEIGTNKTMSQVLKEVHGTDKIATLAGPNHAEEVSRNIPTATVIASDNTKILPVIKKAFETDYFKVYPHEDIIGVDICGAMKNIIAIAVGVCDGLGLGDNAKGSIITLGLQEMNTFGRAYGAKRKTFYGLAGVGDLVATCTSAHSRNRFVGQKIAEGKNAFEIEKEMKGMVAEGVRTVKAAYEFANKRGLKLPITYQAYKVLYESKNIKKAVKDLVRLI